LSRGQRGTSRGALPNYIITLTYYVQAEDALEVKDIIKHNLLAGDFVPASIETQPCTETTALKATLAS